MSKWNSMTGWMSKKERWIFYIITIPLYILGGSWAISWLWVWWKVMFVL